MSDCRRYDPYDYRCREESRRGEDDARWGITPRYSQERDACYMHGYEAEAQRREERREEERQQEAAEERRLEQQRLEAHWEAEREAEQMEQGRMRAQEQEQPHD